jgi:hypothetical protein
MRDWRNPVIVVLLLAVVALAVVSGGEHWYHHHHAKPRKVADVPGPAGSDETFELYYAANGDLTFRPTVGNPIITYYDYYGEVRVARAEWTSPHGVRLTMRDGTVMEIDARFRIDRGRTATSRPTQVR